MQVMGLSADWLALDPMAAAKRAWTKLERRTPLILLDNIEGPLIATLLAEEQAAAAVVYLHTHELTFNDETGPSLFGLWIALAPAVQATGRVWSVDPAPEDLQRLQTITGKHWEPKRPGSWSWDFQQALQRAEASSATHEAIYLHIPLAKPLGPMRAAAMTVAAACAGIKVVAAEQVLAAA